MVMSSLTLHCGTDASNVERILAVPIVVMQEAVEQGTVGAGDAQGFEVFLLACSCIIKYTSWGRK